MAARAPKLNIGDSHRNQLTVGEHVRIEQARRDADRAVEAESKDERMIDWGHLVPERGRPLDFDRFPFQREWYSEAVARCREAVWQKAAQVGMSGYAWRWGGRRAARFGDRVIYFFPTDDDVEKFGDQRIEPSIQDSEYLLRLIPPHYVRHKHLKRIGLGDLSLRGTTSRTSVQSVDGDALIFDEVDYHHQGNLEQALRRLAGAQAAGREPRLRWLGYPTLPGSGINARFERSDKRLWHVTCPECALEQTLTWTENVRWRSEPDGKVMQRGHDEYEHRERVAEVWRCCRECGASFEEDDAAAIRRGRWVATAPGSRVIGFHVSRLIVPYTDLEELVKNSRKTKPHEVEAFWNNDMGLPYVPSEAALTLEDLEAAAAYGGELQMVYRARNPLVMGVDVASERALSGWVDELLPNGDTRAVWIGEPEDFTDVVDLIKRFRPAMVVIDGMPERRQARAVASTFPGIVTIAVYDDRNEADAFKFDPKKNMVTVNRTEAMDAMMDSIRQRRRIPLRTPPRKFLEQMMSPKRRVELSPSGKPKRVYVSTGSEGDDYAHAGVYALVAKEMYLLRAQVEEVVGAAAGNAVADERFGFREDYDPGFGERW